MKRKGFEIPPHKLTPKQKAALKRLAKMPDSAIDLSEMPETTFTAKARRGLFHRPRKASITIRLDEDLLAHYKARAADGRYQTEINRVLREHMEDA